ncbi:uncharacterized protein BDW47DRAFT_98587 [Aspergillus candidus]|uniref:MFS maltose permease n=1 Tax=Aspergillus candidus TaxID=41067 RepID=A0A2I2FME8_ASPCN|nr:hypothetical protein BDW47DRAFT_98587 [Aspergillus candidus]PLB41798.1 hypothetical protein BDW47DRAFT_98587 [Aspergillus candidus]
MLSSRTALRRVRVPRPARPLPTPPHRQDGTLPSRPFTHQSCRQLLSSPLNRPQLPFLSPLSGNRPLPPWPIHLRQHFARLMSTESRNYYRRRISRGLNIGLSFYAILVLFQLIKLGVYQEEIEHQWPTPPEWSWKSRWCLRSAQALQNPEQIGKLMTNWPMVAGYLRDLLERLENLEGEGKGIHKQGDGGFLVEGVGETGYDVSEKSEPWRRGYFQALMGAAKSAESLEGWLTDRKHRISAPAEYVVGPSNPRPKPMPAGQKQAPEEQYCEPASPAPEVFYMKILTTKGFDTRQKLDAALAYADWLDYKGLAGTADDMYRWAMDIAAAGSPVDATQVVDLKTGTLKPTSKVLPTENILRVSTARAVHEARQGNLPTALSIFTSVLQARRSLPEAPSDTTFPSFPHPPKSSRDPFRRLFNTIKTVLVPVEYPAPLPSGNEPPLRSVTAPCDEASLMVYIGEILYASSSKEKGLAWTRDAVEVAESAILRLSRSEDYTPRHRCADCLRVGLENWKTMVAGLVARAKKDELDSVTNAQKAWFGGQKKADARTLERKRWEAESMMLDDRVHDLAPVIEGESGLTGIAPNSSLFV